MGLLAGYRRYWALLGLALLAAPMLIQAMQPAAVSSEGEARILSPAPAWPQSARDWLTLPRGLDRFLADHFGLRTELVRAHARLRYAVDLPSDLRVLIGRDNWLFLNGDGTIEQSTGRVLRTERVERFADHAAALRTHLAGKSAQLVVAVVPNGSTINRARLPAWAGEAPPVTEYDLMMLALEKRGVALIDLRPPLFAANAAAPVYRRTDTHWNKLGALVAYNAVAQAARKLDWVIDPARVLKGFERIEGGDLARLLAVAGDVHDEEAVIDLSPYGPAPAATTIVTQSETGGDLVETGRAGPTVMVIGDSFTRGYWQNYFAAHAGRYVWMHHELCGFNLSIVDEYAPQLVILAPAERQMFCAGRN